MVVPSVLPAVLSSVVPAAARRSSSAMTRSRQKSGFPRRRDAGLFKGQKDPGHERATRRYGLHRASHAHDGAPGAIDRRCAGCATPRRNRNRSSSGAPGEDCGSTGRRRGSDCQPAAARIRALSSSGSWLPHAIRHQPGCEGSCAGATAACASADSTPRRGFGHALPEGRRPRLRAGRWPGPPRGFLHAVWRESPWRIVLRTPSPVTAIQAGPEAIKPCAHGGVRHAERDPFWRCHEEKHPSARS